MFVCDASVLLTALFGTNREVTSKLDRLLHTKNASVHILPFTLIEFANGLRFSTRDLALAKGALEKFAALGLPIMQLTQTDTQAIIELSYRLDTTVYDTAYHYAALMHNGVFITCDRGYFKKASPLEHIELWG